MNHLFATKSVEDLQKDAASATEGPQHGPGPVTLRRVLGPIGLTAIGVGAIIGSGIFVMTGRVAAQEAGPGIMVSFVIAGVACCLAALCYAELAAMVPAAGSAYSYAYATMGELIAWIMGWDLILEYAMACSTVAVGWSHYANQLLFDVSGTRLPEFLVSDPSTPGAWFNLPAIVITGLLTVVLLVGVRESATTNAVLVGVKVGVVLLVIAAGAFFIVTAYYTTVPPGERITEKQKRYIADAAGTYAKGLDQFKADAAGRDEATNRWTTQAVAVDRIAQVRTVAADEREAGRMTAEQADARIAKAQTLYGKHEPQSPEDKQAVAAVLAKADQLVAENVEQDASAKWGLLGTLGLHKTLDPLDDKVRSPFFPYGLSGVIFGASLVFFAYIGFDAVSTHAEEAVHPQKNVPIGILGSLLLCTVLYIAVAAVITGMREYQTIPPKAAVATVFSEMNTGWGRAVAILVELGGLAGMTSVLLISFQAQSRIFLAMARDGLLPKVIFSTLHPTFRTPYISIVLIGIVIAGVAAFTNISVLEEMVNIGTLLAFSIVCGAVMVLRVRRPETERPFRAPLVFVVAPLGILANVILMLFLPWITWMRLIVWLGIGLLIYFSFGYWNSRVGRELNANAAGGA